MFRADAHDELTFGDLRSAVQMKEKRVVVVVVGGVDGREARTPAATAGPLGSTS